jgi:hypothetical protein
MLAEMKRTLQSDVRREMARQAGLGPHRWVVVVLLLAIAAALGAEAVALAALVVTGPDALAAIVLAGSGILVAALLVRIGDVVSARSAGRPRPKR